MRRREPAPDLVAIAQRAERLVTQTVAVLDEIDDLLRQSDARVVRMQAQLLAAQHVIRLLLPRATDAQLAQVSTVLSRAGVVH